MTNLHYSIDLVNQYQSDTKSISDTKYLFNSSPKKRVAFADVLENIESVKNWLDHISQTDKGPKLLLGNTSVNFNRLVESIKSEKLNDIYIKVRSIRQELIVVATKDTIERIKPLYDYWEYLEIPIQNLLK